MTAAQRFWARRLLLDAAQWRLISTTTEP